MALPNRSRKLTTCAKWKSLMAVAKCNLHQRHDRIVALLALLKGKEVIVSAPGAPRKFAADQRPRMIDRAAAGIRIKELAGLAENRIGLAPQYLLALPGSSELFLRLLNFDTKMFRQPFDVARGNLHSIVDRATVGRTLSTIVVASFSFGSCHPWFAHYRLFDF